LAMAKKPGLKRKNLFKEKNVQNRKTRSGGKTSSKKKFAEHSEKTPPGGAVPDKRAGTNCAPPLRPAKKIQQKPPTLRKGSGK